VASFPDLTAFYTRNKGTKFDIVGVSLDDDKDRWIRGIAKHKLTWHHLSDLQKWSSEGAKLYAVNAIPATVLIDKNGKIAGRNLELKEIQELLNQIVTK
jgi:peroxiredoxin